MDFGVYGINFFTFLVFTSVGLLCGIVWQSSLLAYKSIHPTSSIQVIGFILLITLGVMGSYLLVGYVLTSFVYSAIGIGLISEFIIVKIGEIIVFFVGKKLSVNSNTAMLHTLPEGQKR